MEVNNTLAGLQRVKYQSSGKFSVTIGYYQMVGGPAQEWPDSPWTDNYQEIYYITLDAYRKSIQFVYNMGNYRTDNSIYYRYAHWAWNGGWHKLTTLE